MVHFKKKVLIISPYFYPNIEWGGPVTVTLNLVRELKNNGYHVQVLTTNVSKYGKIPYRNSKIIDGVKVTYAESVFPILAWRFRIFISVDQILKGWRIIPRFDIVHFQDTFILQNIFLAARCRALNIPYIITPHGSLSFSRERGKSTMKRFFVYLLSGKYLSESSNIIAVSESEKESIERDFECLKNKTVYIPNIIRIENFMRMDIRSKLNIPKDDIILLSLSRICHLKGVVELASGFLKYLRKYSAKATLIFAGPDMGAVNEIKRLLKGSKFSNKFIFTGEVAGDFKLNLINCSDIVCLLSKSESMPTVILEAASFAKPIICTRECNVDDLVNWGGALLTSRKVEDIAMTINLLSLKRARLEIGRKAKKWFDKRYNILNIINQYKIIYANAK